MAEHCHIPGNKTLTYHNIFMRHDPAFFVARPPGMTEGEPRVENYARQKTEMARAFFIDGWRARNADRGTLQRL
ncbi:MULTISPECIES: hypothetical protein [Sphingomonas]|jgi:hypothetical protein|uniref:Uncharacterized protein n=1 Tax=Sphingomonas zeae TaxID=1646122 RepID=A0A7Y6B382_9SPHN|nr:MULTISPECIES: hypothetical protein [Sphingomonas]MBB4049135.1 hypothetical protein [Sphingomonas zeae]MDK8187104.1 hypothetical protein [Sphingomonas zeae]MDK8217462.1 hypothetical protein [Sphingomonas sp. UMB7805-LC452B]NUU46600.1 hypothetical protein [Sphingomonas zeae]